MPLQEQYIELPLTGGIDEKANKEGNVAGFLGLENCEYDDTDSVRSRHGFVRTASFSTAVERGLTVSGGAMSRAEGGLTVRSVGTWWDGTRTLSADSAITATQILIVTESWVESQSAWTSGTLPPRQIQFSLRNRATWAQVNAVGTSSLGAGSGTGGAFHPRVVPDVNGTSFLVFWLEGNLASDAATLKWGEVDQLGVFHAGGSISTTVSVATNTNGGNSIDALTLAGDATVVVWNNAGANVKLARLTAFAGVSTTFSDTTSTTSGSQGNVAIALAGSSVVALYLDGTNIQASVYPANIASRTRGSKGGTPVFTASGDLMRSLTLYNTSTTIMSCVCDASSGMRVTTYDSGNNAVGSSATYQFSPVTKLNGYRLGVSSDTNRLAGYPSVLIFDVSTQMFVGQAAYEEGGVVKSGSAFVSAMLSGLWSETALAGKKFTTTIPVLEETPDAVSGGATGYVVARTRTVELGEYDEVLPTAQLCGVGYVAGSLPRVWDGSSLIYAAALGVPITPRITATGGISTNLFAYCCVAEYVDGRGNIQATPPSLVATAKSDATISAISVAIDTTLIPGQIRLKTYRTTAGGSVFFLLRTIAGASGTFADATTDVQLSTSETLYTTGNVLPSATLPPLSHLVTHRDRLFGIRADNPRVIGYTQETFDPLLPRWNQVLSFELDNTAGDPNALASVDDKLLIFQDDTVSAINGSGPDATGGTATGTFSVPETVARGAGVTFANRRSVVTIPDGVLFRSKSGIQLLGRDLTLQAVGTSVQRTLGDTVIIGARYFQSRHQVWFFLDTTTWQVGHPATIPPILVFDVRYGRWSTFTGGPWESGGFSVADGAEVSGVVYVMAYSQGGAGAIYKLDTTTWVDKADGTTATYFAQKIKQAWFRGAGRNGQQRLWGVGLHGEVVSGTGMTVTIDAYTQKNQENLKNDSVADNHYAWTTMGSFPAGGFTLPARMVTQRCSAFRLDITFTRTSDVEGLRLNTVSYKYGTEPGKGKAPLGRKPSAS